MVKMTVFSKLKPPGKLHSPLNRSVKKVFDIILVMAALPIVLPLMALLAALIKLESPGPALHIGKRLGKGGNTFNCIKFRTMYLDADRILHQYLQVNPQAQQEWCHYKKLRQTDPRVTKIGRWLRITSLDEIPQFFNVLRGEMSLIGPRPYLPCEQNSMGDYFEDILSVEPGISGLWQVRGRNELAFSVRLKLDRFYVKNWSLYLDIVILLKTLVIVVKRRGAY